MSNNQKEKMKKLTRLPLGKVLPTIFFFLMLFPTVIFAQDDKGCSDTWRSERYACGEAYSQCYEQCGAAPGIAPESCYKACDNTSKACEAKANANFEACKNASKQTSTDCWSTHMVRQYSVCTKAHTECLSPCSVLKTTPERKVCFEDCGKAKDLCTDKAVADYKACVAAQLAPSPADDFGVSVGDGMLFLDDYSEALVEDSPKEEDLSVEDKAAEINKWINDVLGPIDESNIPVEPPNPQETMTKPTIVREPGTDIKRNYYRFSFNTNDPLMYIDAGIDRISLTTPNGITFEPQHGDYLRVPFGTKVTVKHSWQDNDYAGFWVSGTAPDSFVYVKSGEIEIVPPAPGADPRLKTQFKVKDRYTEIRWSYGGGPPMPREIEFEGQPLVKILNKETDFGISYDPETKKIVVEIYDGKITVMVKGEENILASSYGLPIKRMEIEKDGTIVEKTAIPKSEWSAFLASQQKSQAEKQPVFGSPLPPSPKITSYLLPVVVGGGLPIAVLAVIFWYKKKNGRWPWRKSIPKIPS